jgi:hypothetical protein
MKNESTTRRADIASTVLLLVPTPDKTRVSPLVSVEQLYSLLEFNDSETIFLNRSELPAKLDQLRSVIPSEI